MGDNVEWSFDVEAMLSSKLTLLWISLLNWLRWLSVEILNSPLLVSTFVLGPDKNVLTILISSTGDIDNETSLVLDISSLEEEFLPPS